MGKKEEGSNRYDNPLRSELIYTYRWFMHLISLNFKITTLPVYALLYWMSLSEESMLHWSMFDAKCTDKVNIHM